MRNGAVLTPDDVKNEFQRFKNSTINNLTEECENYVLIRLITIVEQFFRAMLAAGRISRRPDIWNEVSVSLLVDIFENYKAQDIDDDYGEGIRVFCKKNNNGYNYDTKKDSIKFQKEQDVTIGNLVTAVLGKRNEKVVEWIKAQTQPFQSVKAIECYTGTFLDDYNEAKKYTMLFNTRHSLTHTLSNKQLDMTYFDLIERLFVEVENNN